MLLIRNQKVNDFLFDTNLIGTDGSSKQSTIDTNHGILGLDDFHLTCTIGVYTTMIEERPVMRSHRPAKTCNISA